MRRSTAVRAEAYGSRRVAARLALLLAWTIPGCDGGPIPPATDGRVDGDAVGEIPDVVEAEAEIGPDADAEPEAVVDVLPESPDDGAVAPWVRFESPGEGATVPNPVTFRIAAGGGVDEVEIFADETYSLGPAWDPAERDRLLYRFSGTGVPRALHVVGRVAGTDAARDDLTITVEPDACADLFFVAEFDAHNTDPSGTIDLVAIREGALAGLRDAVAALQDCGAVVTLGAMISLLHYEGGLRAGAFNTRCEENSYYRVDTGCDVVAEALYSYQLGIGAFHTSNLHPCHDRTYTSRMRTRFLELAEAAGFPVGPELVTAEMDARFHTICPLPDEPSAVDYYVLGAHDLFGIPRDDAGNHLAGCGLTPFFDPAVSIGMTFQGLSAACATISSDREAIAVYGGADPRYGETATQDAILRAWVEFSAASCP